MNSPKLIPRQHLTGRCFASELATLPWLAILLLFVVATQLNAHDRVALLIANSDYGEQQLTDAKLNAQKLSRALEQLGFEVTLKENVEKDFRRELESFLPTCPTGGVSFVYFCGYGSRYERRMSRSIENPDGSKAKEYYTVDDSGIWSTKGNTPYPLDDMTHQFRLRSRARLNMLVLDCGYTCPRAKDDQQGLLPINAATWPGGMLCYATPPKTTLPVETHSCLAESLARSLQGSNQSLRDVMANTKGDVVRQSRGRQQLWVEFSTELDAGKHIAPRRERTIAKTQLPPSNPRPGDEWINGIGMVFCWCPPGEFQMGFPGTPTPQTRDAQSVTVAIRNGFWISKYELTLGDYALARQRNVEAGEMVALAHANQPITGIKGPSAVSFGSGTLDKCEQKAGCVPAGWSYRLPTEAEWEYACRAGSKSQFCFGDSIADLHRYANYADKSLHRDDDSFHYCDQDSNDGIGRRPSPIGSYLPNSWGIHDMHGNVAEFVQDQYQVPLPGGDDPLGVGRKESIVIRGGAWCSLPSYCRSGFRQPGKLSHNQGHSNFRGLRVVLAKKK